MRERRPNPSATSTLTAPGNGNHVPVTFRHLCPETAHVSHGIRSWLLGLRVSPSGRPQRRHPTTIFSGARHSVPV